MTGRSFDFSRRDVLKSFGLGALGLGLGGKWVDSAITHASPGSRWVEKNGLFRRDANLPAKGEANSHQAKLRGYDPPTRRDTC